MALTEINVVGREAAGGDRRLNLRQARIGVLLNTSSGSCDLEAEADLHGILESAGLRAEHRWCGGGADVEAALAEARTHSLDVLVVLGGDGTIRAAAETCEPGGTLLMPLPGGTMNVLPKALYGGRSWREALQATLADPAIQPVHGGVAGGRRFYIAGIFGGPTKLAEAREAVREHDLAGAVEKGVAALRESLSADSMSYRFADRAGVAEAVAVLCPLISRRLDDDERMLEAAAIRIEGTVAALRLALNAAFRDWREDPTVEHAKARLIELSSNQPISAMLDGETFTLEGNLRVEFAPSAFEALRPQGEIEAADD